MENESKFKIELIRGGYLNKHYDNGRFDYWPTGMRVILGSSVLKAKLADGREQQDHYPSDVGWAPGHMLGNGLNILDNKLVYFHTGKLEYNLRFEPAQDDRVQISIDTTNCLPKREGIQLVQPVVVSREYAALQFFKFFNNIVKDIVDYRDAGAFRQIRRDYAESLTQPPIKNLLEKYGVAIAQVPREFLR